MFLWMLIWFTFDNTKQKYGRRNPYLGPLQIRKKSRKNPVLDVGALAKIHTGNFRVVYGIKFFHKSSVELENGDILKLNSVVWGAECCCNVPHWLKDPEFFQKKFSNGWKGTRGLYTARLINGTKGNDSTYEDAIKIARDIGNVWLAKLSKEKQKRKKKMMY
ncbi:hypothetical protein Tco_1022335 [Tanacetum coccineum]